ncbi:hypothetical protein GCM10009853_043930 [Glycomyces scopariae]
MTLPNPDAPRDADPQATETPTAAPDPAPATTGAPEAPAATAAETSPVETPVVEASPVETPAAEAAPAETAAPQSEAPAPAESPAAAQLPPVIDNTVQPAMTPPPAAPGPQYAPPVAAPQYAPAPPMPPAPVPSAPGPMPVHSHPTGPVPTQSMPTGPMPMQSMPTGPIPGPPAPRKPSKAGTVVLAIALVVVGLVAGTFAYLYTQAADESEARAAEIEDLRASEEALTTENGELVNDLAGLQLDADDFAACQTAFDAYNSLEYEGDINADAESFEELFTDEYIAYQNELGELYQEVVIRCSP